MRNRQPPTLPAPLSQARRRFDHWRSRHRPRTKLPEELWANAVELARDHGLNKTARTLRLDYYSLKKHLADTPGPDSEKTTPEFMELLPAGMSRPCSECTIEFDDGHGAKMRIHLKGAEPPDLSVFTRAFWGGEA